MTVFIGIGILAFLLVFLQAAVYRRCWNRSLQAGLSFAAHTMMEGEYGDLYEVVENKKFLPLPLLRVKFSVDSGLVFGRGAVE